MGTRRFKLTDLMSTVASLSYQGDPRSCFVDDCRRIKVNSEDNLLGYLNLHYPQIKKLNADWYLNLDEGDEEILSGRYVPEQFRNIPSSPSALKFGLQFKDKNDGLLIDEILNKTAASISTYFADQFCSRLVCQKPIETPKVIVDAQSLLKSRSFEMEQSFSSSAHCSLFHTLPDTIQRGAVGSSARRRLGRVLNPFNLMNSERDRDILGGPLPWEKKCVDSALRTMVRKSSVWAGLKGLVITGPAKAVSISQFKKLVHPEYVLIPEDLLRILDLRKNKLRSTLTSSGSWNSSTTTEVGLGFFIGIHTTNHDAAFASWGSECELVKS